MGQEAKIIIYILCYDNQTFNNALRLFGSYKWAKVIILPSTILFENYMYDKWLLDNYDEWKDYDYVGTLSWRAREKVILPDIEKMAIFLKNEKIYDLVPFYVIGDKNLLDDIDRRQPNNNIILNLLFNKLGYPNDYIKKDFIHFYCNYWIAKPKIMKEYIDFFYKCKEIINEDPQIQKYIWQYVEYNSGLDENEIKKIFGRPSFSSHPFVYERIPYLFMYKYRILHPNISFEQGLYPQITKNQLENKNKNKFNTAIKIWINKHLLSGFNRTLSKIIIAYDIEEFIIDI